MHEGPGLPGGVGHDLVAQMRPGAFAFTYAPRARRTTGIQPRRSIMRRAPHRYRTW